MVPEILRAHLALLDETLSRTVVTGQVDTKVSGSKAAPLITGAVLTARIVSNRAMVADFIVWRCQWCPLDRLEHFAILSTLAHLAGAGMFPRGLFRDWDYDPSRHGTQSLAPLIPAREVQVETLLLMDRVLELRSIDAEAEGLRMVSSIEWELSVGPLHPFYDACGRISRYYSTLLCLWKDLPLARHKTRDAYFRAARAGRDAFADYYRTAAIETDS